MKAYKFSSVAIGYFKDFKKYSIEFLLKMYFRLRTDCLYYLDNGNKYDFCLWTKDPLTQLELMEILGNYINYNKLGEIDIEEIENFKEKMLGNNFYSLFSCFKWHPDNSFTCKISDEASKSDETKNLFISLLWENDFDFVLAGEDGCLSNYDMYTPIFNSKNGYIYLIPHSVAEKWKEGEIITVYGEKATEEQIKEIFDYLY